MLSLCHDGLKPWSEPSILAADGAPGTQGFDDLLVLSFPGVVQGSLTAVVLGIDVGAFSQQELHDVEVAVIGRGHQSCASICILHVYVPSLIQQAPHGSHVTC